MGGELCRILTAMQLSLTTTDDKIDALFFQMDRMSERLDKHAECLDMEEQCVSEAEAKQVTTSASRKKFEETLSSLQAKTEYFEA
ncbi:hypothetical protein NDU88_006409 [Pleurodeles waltl]|uniref:Uncharacterized protein n=1 Tax=Pleurodeles waltl TaxID=8319 RepID=A0AAV7WE60_PLEWA|nr:hypothetical protein NDU88_006409 [Pleurodeles waltl]